VPLSVLMLMDPIASIDIRKDSSFAMLLEAQRRGHELLYATPDGLLLDNGRAVGMLAPLRVQDDRSGWFELGAAQLRGLAEADVILMRRDPPVDEQYLYQTMILERAAAEGAMVVNRPDGLRGMNEKLATLAYPDLCPPSLVARDMPRLRDFVHSQGEVVVKPLDGMGGRSIFRSHAEDPNLNVILETLTDEGRKLALAQRYLPEIRDGDKRILLVDGEAVPFALARMPGDSDHRGNLARGGKGVALPLSPRDREIAATIGPDMRDAGMLFVGLDVIGDFLTEINVTSPTCIRELDAQCDLNIAGLLFDAIESRLG
jgi:glutathione synthase